MLHLKVFRWFSQVPESPQFLIPFFLLSQLSLPFPSTSSLSAMMLPRIDLKWWSLVILVIQNSTLVLLMRYSRSQPQLETNDMLYIPSTAVFTMEVVKFITCCILHFYLDHQAQWRGFLNSIYRHLIQDTSAMLNMLIPAGLYAFQNNLLYVAISNLDAATYQVSYQLKILTTALFAKALLQKTLTRQHWMALFLLTLGVALVQLQSISSSSPTEVERRATNKEDEPVTMGERKLNAVVKREPRSSESSSLNTNEPPQQNPLLGFGSVILACISSGYAGVYFERLLKSRSASSAAPSATLSLWMRNLQLGGFGLFFSLLAMVLNDGQRIMEHGMFVGYNTVTWLVILNQALGGLVVSMTVKHADNILKGFATSLSMCVSGVLSIFIFDFQPSLYFVIGTSIVAYAAYMYARADAGK